MSEKNMWLVFVAMAGLSWGTYVPLIFYGGMELGGKPASRLLAILCVGAAYFVIGVVFPAIYLVMTPAADRPEMNTLGLVFSSLAGAAGAIGAICVIFATKSAITASKGSAVNYKLYIGPLIFGLAPVINTLVSTVWHPTRGKPFEFHVAMPGWKLWLGIVLVGVGAALVLFSKEEAEATHKPAVTQAAPRAAATSGPAAQEASP